MLGTTYPVRGDLAAQFLLAMLRRLSIGHENRTMDLATAALIERRNLRFFADLTVLTESDRLDSRGVPALIEKYLARVEAEPSNPLRENLMSIEARILAEARLIDDADLPPTEWGMVPYPAFFSVLGLPWTTLLDPAGALQ